MKISLLIKCFLIFGLSLVFGCSNDSDENSNSNDSITLFIDEYPNSGTFLLELTSSLEGNVSFSITTQTVSQALIISGNQLTVGDWLAFDYETNELIEAEIKASNGSETQTQTVIVMINDIDDIWRFLSGNSRTVYENANNGEWITISESEYNDLANYLAETSKSGANDNQLFSGASVENSSGNRTIANDNDITIPSNSYVFAFKYYSWINNVGSSRVKLSQNDAGGSYEDLGSVLPEHDDEFNHFVLKGGSEKTTSETFIGMYASGSIGVKSDSESSYKWRNGNVDNLDNTANGIVYLHQGLSTTLKQWD